MPLVYMNSWASLALRAAALATYAIALLAGALAGSAQIALGATALLLAASAAHPLSVSLRLGGGAPPGLLAVAEGVVALALATMLALAAGTDPQAAAHAAALAAPLALGLAVIALVNGVTQHDRLLRSHGPRWAAMPVAIAIGSAGVAVIAALQAEAAAHVGTTHGGIVVVGSLALAAWVTHSALRLRRARRSAVRARQRDWMLVHSRRPAAATPPTGRKGTERRLSPIAQWQ